MNGYKKEDFQNALIRVLQGSLIDPNDVRLLELLIEDWDKLRRENFGLRKTTDNLLAKEDKRYVKKW